MYRYLGVPACELRLEPTLTCGQVFSWHRVTHRQASRAPPAPQASENSVGSMHDSSSYVGMVNKRHVIELRENANDVGFRVLRVLPTQNQNQNQSSSPIVMNMSECELDQVENDIRHYFQLRPKSTLTETEMKTEGEDEREYAVDQEIIVKNDDDSKVEHTMESTTNGAQHIELSQLHTTFSQSDPIVYSKVYRYFPGLRVVRQDPFECLISFICSSNNNVSRITLMVHNLCKHYGTAVGSIKISSKDANDSKHTTNTVSTTGEPMKHDAKNDQEEKVADESESSSNDETEIMFYTFPTRAQLSRATEKELRDLGFGYRAKFIVKTVEMLGQKDEDYLLEMRQHRNANQLSSFEIVDRLTEFPGVGTKVASCTALYSMDCNDLVPTDVHILRLVRLHYCPLLERKAKEPSSGDKSFAHLLTSPPSKSITAPKMKEYMRMFISIFGEYAGWAQMILYGCQTHAFKKKLPSELQCELFTEEASSSSKPKNKPKPKKARVMKDEDDDDDDDYENDGEPEQETPPSRKRPRRRVTRSSQRLSFSSSSSGDDEDDDDNQHEQSSNEEEEEFTPMTRRRRRSRQTPL